MLVECGFVRAVASDGSEFTFTPSLGRIAALGDPHSIVALFADLHGPRAPRAASEVLAVLCDQDDPTPLVGWHDEALTWHPGEMPEAEQIIMARHLMRHGIVGEAKPSEAGSGEYSSRFDASEYVAGARAHLGLSSADAEGLSMTELQRMLAMKFPEAKKAAAGRDVPTRAEYDAAMARLKERSGG